MCSREWRQQWGLGLNAACKDFLQLYSLNPTPCHIVPRVLCNHSRHGACMLLGRLPGGLRASLLLGAWTMPAPGLLPASPS